MFFDNLQVTHTSGHILEETHYYPFGLVMAGISTKALGITPKNVYKFNGGVELEEEIGLNYCNTFYRKYDAQVGRFTGVDMLAEKFFDINPYQFAFNNPITFNDPLGDQNKAPGRSVKGPDGNYHTGWYGNMLWDYWNNNNGDISFFGLGNGGSGKYEAFWSNLLSNLGDGNTKTMYAYQNLSGSGQYVEDKYDGLLGWAAGEQYHFVGIETWTTYHFDESQIQDKIGELLSKIGDAYTSYVDPVFVWLNENINPLTPIIETILGKEYSAQGFVNDKSRLNSFAQVTMQFCPIGKVVGRGERIFANVAAKTGTSVLSAGDALRIENAATRIGKPITVVGSRAKGTAGAFSDWDYVIEGLNNKGWKQIKNSLPGSKSVLDNTPRNIDIFKTLDPTKPHITIYPR